MEEETLYLPSLKFPHKLWHIINACDSGAISWGSTGYTILLNYNKFQDEFLSRKEKIFKTNNMTSFIRQLNMYGFRKVNSHKSEVFCGRNQNVHEFFHENFQFGRMDLLDKVCRKTGTRNCRNEHNCDNDIRMKLITKYIPEELELPMTQLQACQVALREALHESLVKYEEHQTRQLFDEMDNFEYDEFKFYYFKDTDLLKNELQKIILFVPKMTNAQDCDWYNEMLANFVNNYY